MPTKTKNFTVKQNIDIEKVRGALCCAFEGGSNYWYMIDKVIYPKGRKKSDYDEGGAAQDGKNYWNWSQLVPTTGGALIISTKENDEIDSKKEWVLNRETLQRGLDVMAEKYPKHFGDLVSENDDADTGDVLLQLALFGDLVFG